MTSLPEKVLLEAELHGVHKVTEPVSPSSGGRRALLVPACPTLGGPHCGRSSGGPGTKVTDEPQTSRPDQVAGARRRETLRTKITRAGAPVAFAGRRRVRG